MNGNTPSDGYFGGFKDGNKYRFKIQIEDGSGGTNPGGDWTYFSSPNPGTNQQGFQGSGYYLYGPASSTSNNRFPPDDSLLEYKIVIPEGEGGVYQLRARASRDPGGENDKKNDFWLKINEDAENYQVSSIKSLADNQNKGFIKIFGAGSNGNWGYSQTIDSQSHDDRNPRAEFNLSAGTHIITIGGRSNGYHMDSFELYKGYGRDGPSNNAESSQFITDGGASDPVVPPSDPGGAPNDPFADELIAEYDQILFHFDGNNNDDDDIAALPVAAALAKAAGIEDKITFFYSNNLAERDDAYQVQAMRESAAFAESLGIQTYDYTQGTAAATQALTDILNSGQKILSIEGGPMEAIYRGLEGTSNQNLSNISLLSHSGWNENRDVVNRPGETQARTWADIRSDFPEVALLEIRDQNNGSNNDRGFNNRNWTLLDDTTDPVLQEMREMMVNARGKVNDPSDAGMLFYALTGNQDGTPQDALAFWDQYPLSGVTLPPNDEDPVSPPEPGDGTFDVDDLVLTLIDASTDTVLGVINPDGGITPAQGVTADDIANAPRGSLTISVTPASTDASIGSMRLTANDGSTQTENIVPYALYGDNDTGYLTGAGLQNGENTLALLVYQNPNATGAVYLNETVTFDLAIEEPDPTGSVAGRYFVDLDGDNRYDNAETGVSGATVRLLNGSGQQVATTQTAANGTYAFNSLEAGTYRVAFEADDQGRDFVTANVGNEAGDSDVTGTNASNEGVTDVFALADGGQQTGVNAGLALPPEADPGVLSISIDDLVFSLVNAETDILLGEIIPGSGITPANGVSTDDIANAPRDALTISVTAASPETPIGSMVLSANGGASQTENFSPFALFGDRMNGDYILGTGLQDGQNSLSLQIFEQGNGGGTLLLDETVNFELSAPSTPQDDAPTPPPAAAPSVPDGAEYIRAFIVTTSQTTDEVVTEVSYGDVLDKDLLLDAGPVGFYVETTDEAPDIESMRLSYLHRSRIDNLEIYSLYGNRGDDFLHGPTFGVGDHAISLQMYSENGGQGTVFADFDFEFSVA